MDLFLNNLDRDLLFAWKSLLALAVKHDQIQADPVIDIGDTKPLVLLTMRATKFQGGSRFSHWRYTRTESEMPIQTHIFLLF